MDKLSKNELIESAVDTTKKIIALIATCIGIGVIIIGLRYAMDIFQLIFSILQSPRFLSEPISQIAEIIGGTASSLSTQGGPVSLVNILALIFYFFGALLCAWLTLAMMHTGAKIVSLNVGEQRAVKKLLHSAFGKKMQPQKAAATAENDGGRISNSS